jgi:C-methyltransferase C-terminal domain/Putative zinc binding domain/Methyltransferase domain
MRPSCRFCGAPLSETFADLGLSPLSNAYVRPDQLGDPEAFFPLHVFVCSECLLVQLPEHASPEAIFSDYAYLSSYSDIWLAHCATYADRMIGVLGLDSQSLVVELASNDGCLLKAFQDRGVPVLGIEPARNVAEVAVERGISTEVGFFGRATAQSLVDRGKRPRLIAANNVLAHVPDLNDFVAGVALLADRGTIVTMEFPHLLRMIEQRQFDTIYHEHFSYFSMIFIERLMRAHGLVVHDVEELSTHGGSLRIYLSAADDNVTRSPQVDRIRDAEVAAKLDRLGGYRSFQDSVVKIKCDVLSFLIGARSDGLSVAGYGAPAKAQTLLNYCGVGPELLPFTVDRNPLKQGCFLPGSRIPVLSPEAIFDVRPDFVFILPWNLRREIVEQLSAVRDWGGRFVVPIPALEIAE